MPFAFWTRLHLPPVLYGKGVVCILVGYSSFNGPFIISFILIISIAFFLKYLVVKNSKQSEDSKQKEISEANRFTNDVLSTVNKIASKRIQAAEAKKDGNTGSPNTAHHPPHHEAATNFSQYDYVASTSATQGNPYTEPDISEDELFAKHGGFEAELLTIDLMTDTEFRDWCIQMVSKRGYSISEFPTYGPKIGIHFIARYRQYSYAIFCNHNRSDVAPSCIQKIINSKDLYHCDACIVITNQHFTAQSKDLAKETGTTLWDRDSIIDYLTNEDAYITNGASHKIVISDTHDPFLCDAVDWVFQSGQASVSSLQRHLKLGYARTAHIIDEMEKLGIVGPFNADKPRKIIISRKDWENRIEFKDDTLPF